MINWFTAVVAVLQFGRELFKYLRENKECSRKDAAGAIKDLKSAMKEARKKGDTSVIENKFKSLGLSKPE